MAYTWSNTASPPARTWSAFTIPGTSRTCSRARADGRRRGESEPLDHAVTRSWPFIESTETRPSRLRIYFLSGTAAPDVPILQERMNNSFPGLGDDMLQLTGVGEFAAAWRFSGRHDTGEVWRQRCNWWPSMVGHFSSTRSPSTKIKFTTSTFEKVNAVTPIADLRWSIAHVPNRPAHAQSPEGDRGQSRGAWLALSSQELPRTEATPCRTIVDSGIHVWGWFPTRQRCRCSIRGSRFTTW